MEMHIVEREKLFIFVERLGHLENQKMDMRIWEMAHWKSKSEEVVIDVNVLINHEALFTLTYRL